MNTVNLYYFPSWEYALLMGSPTPEGRLRQAKHIITNSKELSEDYNNYSRIMLLQKIVRDAYQGFTVKELDIYELHSFIPFLNYELEKEEENINFIRLQGLATNRCRYNGCVWVNGNLNQGVIKYINNKTKGKLIRVDQLNIDSILQEYDKIIGYNFDKEEDFFSTSIQTKIITINENNSLADLMKFEIYSYAIRLGLEKDQNF